MGPETKLVPVTVWGITRPDGSFVTLPKEMSFGKQEPFVSSDYAAVERFMDAYGHLRNWSIKKCFVQVYETRKEAT